MKKGIYLFWTGLILIMAGIYLSTIWEVPGMLMGIFGGMMMGGSTYFYLNGEQNRGRKSNELTALLHNSSV